MYFFCTASKTTRDVSQILLDKPNIPEHLLEKNLLLEDIPLTLNYNLDEKKLLQIFKVYINNFIAIAQTFLIEDLQKITRVIL